ncbi:MAG: 50S ribosomal protein L13 [Phycisphaerae bacterium]|nr:50S ribosomal protein L13 [Phycisphaerae bacterium]
MPTPVTKSYMARRETYESEWFVVDATDKTLGRLAVRLASILMGKHKPTYTPHVDTGDFVIVVNADKIRVTGRKMQQKIYDWYTHYPGGRKVVLMEDFFAKHPTRVLELAVRRMLPKTRLGRKMFGKLKVYAGPDHQHAAQQPKVLEIET